LDEKSFDRWIRKIQSTEEEEISCTECFEFVSDYVDTELAGAEIDGVLRRVKHHLVHCKACQDEYEMLRDLASEENRGISSDTDAGYSPG
jgi:hypothetical protein